VGTLMTFFHASNKVSDDKAHQYLLCIYIAEVERT